MGGVGVLVVLLVWGGLGALVTLVWLIVDLTRVTRNEPTLAFAYAGLAVEGTRPLRRWLAELVVVVLPFLAGWGASSFCAAGAGCGWELESQLLWCTPVALWLVNWLFWLAPSARTLGDRLAGSRISIQPKPTSQLMRPRPWWPDALLVLPPALALPFSGGTGGVIGLLAALAILAVPVWVTRHGA